MSLESLVARWARESTALLPPETPAAIVAAFARTGTAATRDVVSLYSTLGGMEIMDDGCLRIWPLQEIEKQPASEAGVIFADYLMDSWCFRLRPLTPDTSAVYFDAFDGRASQLVANDVLQFLDLYEHDPKKAHAW